MRKSAGSGNGDFEVRVVAGTRTILMALNCSDSRRKGLRGFAFHRKLNGAGEGKWLRSQKVFKSLVKDPKKLVDGKKQVFTTQDHPIQSFIWSDYTAEPGKTYEFRILPMYGKPGASKSAAADELTISIKTEPEDDPNGHGIWFNRGAIAGQFFANEFGNIKPSTQQLEDVTQPVTKWLSRGLVEACLAFINGIEAGEALRACVYEFTYKPVLNALKAAIDRGVDVRITYHATDANDKAITAAELPKKVGNRRILYPRTVPKIPHNKFMVRITDGEPVAVWTGSTNFTPSGFLGQSNVGHLVRDVELARKYVKYWEAVSKDPDALTAKKASTLLTPHPEELLPKKSVTALFSPRHRATMLQWYANRMMDATQTVMFTAAFGVNTKLVLPLAQDRDFLRFVLMEKRPAKEVSDALRGDRDLVISYGAVLGQTSKFQDGKKQTVRISDFGLDRWFEEEEHYRKSGNIFFVHTKFLLIDPLSEDPLVCSGSANFSDNSLTQNDENMLLIRGNKRVADIYLTEFDRIFRHFYFRDVANDIELKGKDAEGAFLDESDSGPKNWTNTYFFEGAFKTRRREMFFTSPAESWVANAANRPARETSQLGDRPVKNPT